MQTTLGVSLALKSSYTCEYLNKLILGANLSFNFVCNGGKWAYLKAKCR